MQYLVLSYFNHNTFVLRALYGMFVTWFYFMNIPDYLYELLNARQFSLLLYDLLQLKFKKMNCRTFFEMADNIHFRKRNIAVLFLFIL
jgi:hypothetical protein